ncbi:MAG: hypothetical protein HRT82_15825 [Henriciella sp.]|nr:hypothetical protein [Henriciella sp.]
MATNNEIITLVLQKVDVLMEGETSTDISADDLSTMQDVLSKRVEFLREHNAAWWDDDSVPESAADSLADYLTYYCVIIPKSERMAFRGDSVEGFRQLVDLGAMQSSDEPIQADYF